MVDQYGTTYGHWRGHLQLPKIYFVMHFLSGHLSSMFTYSGGLVVSHIHSTKNCRGGLGLVSQLYRVSVLDE